LSREFDRFDDFVDGLLSDCGVSSGDEVFCRVHVLRFVLKELLSSPGPREQGRSGRNAPAGARAAGQWSLSNRGAGTGGMNTTEDFIAGCPLSWEGTDR